MSSMWSTGNLWLIECKNPSLSNEINPFDSNPTHNQEMQVRDAWDEIGQLDGVGLAGYVMQMEDI
jgi:hypothetical protein